MQQPKQESPSTLLPSVAPLRTAPSISTVSESTEASPSRLSRVQPIPRTDTPKRILGIDIENGPDWYGGGDFVYDRVFCISHKWVGSPDDDVHTTWIEWDKKDATIRRLLEPLWDAIDEADRLLGHNFRHDWRGLTTLFRDLGIIEPARAPVLDTMRCIPRGIPRSLEALCARFALGEKPHLTNHDWTLALRRKDPAKIELVKHRNRMDVVLTERLYHKERELGWLTNRTRTR